MQPMEKRRLEELLREGRLSETLTELQNRVRKDPSNAKLRVFLFQLLAVAGNWERALTQLKVAGDLDPSALSMVHTYREALKCEALRSAVFAGERSPLIFGEPERWIALVLEALRLGAQGTVAQSQAIRDEAFALAPATTGSIGGRATAAQATAGEGSAEQKFDWFADADPRLGPMVEAIVNGRYYWIPVSRIKRIDIEPVADLRDVVWLPAHLTFATGGESVALLPARYPGSEAAEDPALRLARRTEWIDRGDDLFLGLGQRMFATDTGEYPMLDIQHIAFDVEDQAASDPQDR
jgi:type VI secretion system protein ImpE